MRLSKVTIENFRGIQYAEMEFDRDITVLLGENNSGKTSILEALRLCLDTVKSEKSGSFTEFDFYRDDKFNDLNGCKPITLTLTYLESKEHPWPDHITENLDEVIVGGDYAIIKLRVTARYDAGELVRSWCFLDDANNEMAGRSSAIKDLRRLRPFFFRTALRAAKDEFHGQSPHWSSFLRNKDFDEETRKALEEELNVVNRKIVDAHGSFQDVTREVKRISELVPLGKVDAVTVDPTPPDVYRTLRYGTDVNLLTASNAKIPIRCHGEGTQSLSVLLLFNAYLKTRLQADVDKKAEPIIAIEEPEAHLHPNAVRSVWQLLEGLPGQKIVATHSGDILSEVPLQSLRRLNRKGNTTECRAIPIDLLSSEESRKFNHHVRRNRGELLFARTWLLVEGETEVSVFEECADLLDINLHLLGVRIVECSQAGGPGIFIKVADALGIHWHLVADGDDGGKKYVKAAKDLLGAREESIHISTLSTSNIDVLLCHSGFGAPYSSGLTTLVEETPDDSIGSWDDVLAEMKATFPDKPGQALRVAKRQKDRSKPKIQFIYGTLEYWEEVYRNLPARFSKPAAAMEAILTMRNIGRNSVPAELATILNKIS